MPESARLKPRHEEVLHAVVRAYISTGEPVASRTISQERRDQLSPATIRNIMSDLCDAGYLSQPHTSAGRLPTQKAFQHYVLALQDMHSLHHAAAHGLRNVSAELARLRTELSEADSFEQQVERGSRMLTELTRGFGIAAAFPDSSQILDALELVPLAGRRVLMVVVTRDRIVRNRAVTLDEPVDATELASIRNYVNRNFGGWTLLRIRAELRSRLAEDRAAYDDVLRKLALLYAKGLLDIDLAPEVHVEGAGNLAAAMVHLNEERLRDLVRALEEKKRILEMLDRFLEQPAGEIAIRVGLGEAHPSMAGLSFIGTSLSLGGALPAKIAVIGPMRMNYAKAIAAVMNLGEALRSLPA